MLHTAAQV